jgi:hypothetical protein
MFRMLLAIDYYETPFRPMLISLNFILLFIILQISLSILRHIWNHRKYRIRYFLFAFLSIFIALGLNIIFNVIEHYFYINIWRVEQLSFMIILFATTLFVFNIENYWKNNKISKSKSRFPYRYTFIPFTFLIIISFGNPETQIYLIFAYIGLIVVCLPIFFLLHQARISSGSLRRKFRTLGFSLGFLFILLVLTSSSFLFLITSEYQITALLFLRITFSSILYNTLMNIDYILVSNWENYIENILILENITKNQQSLFNLKKLPKIFLEEGNGEDISTDIQENSQTINNLIPISFLDGLHQLTKIIPGDADPHEKSEIREMIIKQRDFYYFLKIYPHFIVVLICNSNYQAFRDYNHILSERLANYFPTASDIEEIIADLENSNKREQYKHLFTRIISIVLNQSPQKHGIFSPMK